MKKLMTMAAIVAVVALAASTAMAQPGWGPMMGRGGMHGWTGGMPGRGPGGECPGWAAFGGGGTAATPAITEEKATELAKDYAAKYFKGYAVERVLPFQGRMHTMYQVELKGPGGEKRVLHVTPWGGVRPFGPLASVE
jgi:hypothetical protein